MARCESELAEQSKTAESGGDEEDAFVQKLPFSQGSATNKIQVGEVIDVPFRRGNDGRRLARALEEVCSGLLNR